MDSSIQLLNNWGLMYNLLSLPIFFCLQKIHKRSHARTKWMMLTVNIGQVLATVKAEAFSCLTSVSMPVIHVPKVTSVVLEIEREYFLEGYTRKHYQDYLVRNATHNSLQRAPLGSAPSFYPRYRETSQRK